MQHVLGVRPVAEADVLELQASLDPGDGLAAIVDDTSGDRLPAGQPQRHAVALLASGDAAMADGDVVEFRFNV